MEARNRSELVESIARVKKTSDAQDQTQLDAAQSGRPAEEIAPTRANELHQRSTSNRQRHVVPLGLYSAKFQPFLRRPISNSGTSASTLDR